MPLKGLLSSKSGGLFGGSGAGSVLSDEERLAMLDEMEQSGLGWFWASDEKGNLTYLSGAIADRLDVPLEDMIGKPMVSVFEPQETGGRTKSLSLMLGARKSFSSFAVRVPASKNTVVLRLSGRIAETSKGKFAGFRGTGADITEEYFREEETARLAKYDSLTGLSNRYRMSHLIETTLVAFKAAKRNCAIMMLDLDKFKHVNDTLGHAAGDELLKQVSDRLSRAIDVDCEIGRLGGDEFQVLIPDMDDRGELGEIAMKIIAMLKQPYSLEEGRCVIGASVGIAIAPHDGVTGEEIVKAADLALYAAKNGGRGQYRFFSADLENEAIFRRRLEADLTEAVRENQLFLKYQPMISAKSGKVEALEAKICWNHSQRGEIEEEEFASIMDGSNQAGEVAQWAIGQACRDAAMWPEGIRAAINVPVQMFTSSDLVENITRAVNEAELNPSQLELQVNEAVFFGDTNTVDRALGGLFKLGVRLTLDQFGSGYSSLAYLRRAPFDAISIDEKLVSEVNHGDGRELGLIKAIVALAGALEMETVADGVETMDMHTTLGECGITYLQGSIYSDPISLDAVHSELIGDEWQLEPDPDRTKRARRRTVFRKIQVIHDDHSYEVTLRNLSKTGALIQGLADVPKGTQFVVDFGGGQLAVATVTRSNQDTQGLEFEQSLVDDGSGGLCTRHRVSPYALASAGAPLAALSPGSYKGMQGGTLGQSGSVPLFAYSTTYQHEAA